MSKYYIGDRFKKQYHFNVTLINNYYLVMIHRPDLYYQQDFRVDIKNWTLIEE